MIVAKMSLIVAGLVAAVVLGGMAYLLTADIPAPSQPVSKTLNNDRFPS